MSDRWADHVARARAGDRQAAAELVSGNMGLVVRGAARLAGYHVEHEDLVAEGILGLLEAIRAHDLTRGSTYTTTATHWIRLRQLGAVRAARTVGTVSRSQLAGRLWWALPQMWADAQQTPDPVASLVDAIAARLGHRPRPEDAIAAANAAPTVTVDSDDYPLPSSTNPEHELQREELAHVVRTAVGQLPDDERELVVRTVFGDETMTDLCVGEPHEIHAARMRASRIRRRALNRLRAQLSEAE